MDRETTRRLGSHRSVEPELRPTNRRVESFSDAVFAIVILSVALAFVNVWLAWLCFASVPPMLFLPIVRARIVRKDSPEDHRDMEHSCP